MTPMQTWTLVDHDQDLYLDQIALGPEQVGGAAEGYSVVKRTLRAGLSQGVDVIEVRNGDFRFVVVPTRGMGIWRACLGDMHLGWKSPVRGPVHPAYVRVGHPDGLGWLDGFDELLVRCGLESNGAPEFQADGRLRYGLHGKIANIPAHKVEVAIDGEAGRIAIRGTVDEARMFGGKLRLETSIETQVGRPGLVVHDTVTNLSAAASDFELLYHINFGVPLVQPGAKVSLPVKKLAPRDAVAVADLPTWNLYGPETPGSTEVCFFMEPAARRRRQHAGPAPQSRGDAGRGPEIQHAAIALLYDLEESRSGLRRLRHGAGTGNELSQHQVVREANGPRRRARAGPVAEHRRRVGTVGQRGRRAGGRRGHRTIATRRSRRDPRPARSALVVVKVER